MVGGKTKNKNEIVLIAQFTTLLITTYVRLKKTNQPTTVKGEKTLKKPKHNDA